MNATERSKMEKQLQQWRCDGDGDGDDDVDYNKVKFYGSTVLNFDKRFRNY